MNHLCKLRQLAQLNHCDHLQGLTLKPSVSSTEPYIKTLCIICQKRKTSEDTHKVKTTRIGLRMLQVLREIEHKVFSYG